MRLGLFSDMAEILGIKAPLVSQAQKLFNLAQHRRYANERSRRLGMSAKTHGRTYEDIGGKSRRGKWRGTPRLQPAIGYQSYAHESPNQQLSRERRERNAAA